MNNRSKSRKKFNFRYYLAKFILKKDKDYAIICLEEFVNKSHYKQSELFTNKKIDVFFKKRNRSIMCKASEVGKIVVNKCLKRHFDINTQKLQKLLVLIQVECIRQSGYPLFSEDIRVWDCGVAIKEVDEDFRVYSTKFSDFIDENITLLEEEDKYIDTILNKYGQLSASDLNKLDINQKVISLGQIKDKDKVPHITTERLTEEFNRCNNDLQFIRIN